MTRQTLSLLFRGLVLCAALFCAVISPTFIQAQDNTPTISAPEDVSLSAIKSARERVEARTDLSEAQQANITQAYDTAESALKNAQNNLDEAKRLTTIIVNGPQRMKTCARISLSYKTSRPWI